MSEFQDQYPNHISLRSEIVRIHKNQITGECTATMTDDQQISVWWVRESIGGSGFQCADDQRLEETMHDAVYEYLRLQRVAHVSG